MNLLIEQNAISSRSRRSHHAMNSSSPALIFKFKRDTNNAMANDEPPPPPATSRSNSSRPKRLTVPNSRRSSSPAFNGKQQTSKRSVNTDNNNNDLSSQPDENAMTKRFKSDEFNVRVGSVNNESSLSSPFSPRLNQRRRKTMPASKPFPLVWPLNRINLVLVSP